MESSFKIFQSGSVNERPPVSSKIREYFEQFISNNVLEKKKIIIGGKWNIYLSIMFTGDGPKVLFERISLAKDPRIVKSEHVKIYFVFIRVKHIRESENPLLKTIELMYEAIKIFLTTTYNKKITSEFMDELWKQVDLEYLLSLPYPAPLEEQKYTGHVLKSNEQIEVLN